MQEEIYIQSQSPFENIHELIRRKLRFQYALQWYLRTRSWNLNAAHTALDEKYADLVTRESDVNLVPLAFRVALPRDNNSLVCKCARRVFERPKFRLTATALELALMVVLLGERKEETLFAGRH